MYTCLYMYTVHGLTSWWLTYVLSMWQVLVHEGELIMGHVDKKTVGSSAQGLIHTSWLEKGWDTTRLFMNMVRLGDDSWRFIEILVQRN